jgi:NAD(P)-dependent dehydrogenase (short-subunit alcohol dehydrogenase family)
MTPRTVFITGASSGLGRGLAQHYARAGSTVYAAARRRDRLDELARESSVSGGSGQVVPLALDVSDTDALEGAVREAERDSGGALDLVIANAGIADHTHARKIDWRVVRRIMDVNVTSACVTVSAALPAMVERGSGTVAAISSMAAFRGLPGNAAYSASKAALYTFMESLRTDLHGSGVRAISVHPGFVKTEMTARNRFPMPFLMELDDAVSCMTRGIERGEAVIAFPRPMVALMRAIGWIPDFAWERLAGRARTF